VRLKVLVYRSKREPRPNFGDALSPWLIERVFSIRCEPADVYSADLAACGSIIDWCHARRFGRLLRGRRASPMYWGSGTARAGPLLSIAPDRILALRGPRTHGRIAGLSGARIPYGDPALLLAEVEVPAEARLVHAQDIVIVPHLSHQRAPEVAQLANRFHCWIVGVTEPVEAVISAIASARLVVSSSLHGLVAAAALGRAFVWFHPEQGRVLDAWKFEDFFASIDASVQRASSRELMDLSRAALYARATAVSARVIADRCAGLRAAFTAWWSAR
jgi:pyruvyltransferase